MAKKDSTFIKTFQEGVEELITKAVKSSNEKITEEEIKTIIDKLKPDLDEIISNRMKEHFVEIAEFILKRFKFPPEEKK